MIAYKTKYTLKGPVQLQRHAQGRWVLVQPHPSIRGYSIEKIFEPLGRSGTAYDRARRAMTAAIREVEEVEDE